MATQWARVKDGEGQPSGGPLGGSGVGGKITEFVRNSREFLHDVRMEMKQVTWPSREDVISTTGVVIGTVVIFGVYLFFVEQLAQRGFEYVLKHFAG